VRKKAKPKKNSDKGGLLRRPKKVITNPAGGGPARKEGDETVRGKKTKK